MIGIHMAFNVNSYIKDTAKSAATKILDRVAERVTAGMPSNTKTIVNSTAQTLFNIGASYDSVESLASKKTDNVVSGAADEFFAFAGRAINRTGGAAISQLRRGNQETTSSYEANILPATKIEQAKTSNSVEILKAIL